MLTRIQKIRALILLAIYSVALPYLPYVGSIIIRDKKMVFSLSADNQYYHQLEPVEWNGSYTLFEKK